MPVRTYIDTGVLVAAFRGDDAASEIALSFLNDPLREYVTSDYVTIELFPHCTYNKRSEERQFYEEFFKRNIMSVSTSDELLTLAIEHGCKTGISGIDAIHVACALASGAAEIITSERLTKPIHRAEGIRVISINPFPPRPRRLSLCERLIAFICEPFRRRDHGH